jgi:hypothetical protein
MSHKKNHIQPTVILTQRIESAFRQLLESKHLYQSLQVDLSTNGVSAIEDAGDSNEKFALTQQWISYHQANWLASDPTSDQVNPISFVLNNIFFRPPDIKTFCGQCDRIEAFNLTSIENFLARGGAINTLIHGRSGTVQIFVLSYLCQSCKSIPEVFLIRREGTRLTLSGRSPIEHVDVPKTIPKSVEQFFSSAIVAHQSGQSLAGNFLLRTLIEQFAKTKALNPKTADDAIDQYMDGLPDDFKTRFPSFRDIYSVLSSDIHSAIGSPEVFDESKAKIIKHFEARQLFDL